MHISGPSVDARLLNKATGTDVTLTVKAYEGFVRLLVNEDASKKRFEVPGVLMHDLGNREGSWSKKAQTAKSLHLQLGDAELQLQYSPLQIGVSIKGQPVMTFNGRQMFNFEHLRQKQVIKHFIWYLDHIWCIAWMQFTAICPISPGRLTVFCSTAGGRSRGVVGGDIQGPC